MSTKSIASTMICGQPRFAAGRLILSAYDGVWDAVEDIPAQLKPYVTDDLGNSDVSYGGSVQITDTAPFQVLPGLGLFACFRLIGNDLLTGLNVRPPTEFYRKIEGELQLVGWDIFTGNGWRSASTDGYFPIHPFTGEVLGDLQPNEFGLVREEIECINLCAMNNEKASSWAPWNPVGVCLDRLSYERLRSMAGGQNIVP